MGEYLIHGLPKIASPALCSWTESQDYWPHVRSVLWVYFNLSCRTHPLTYTMASGSICIKLICDVRWCFLLLCLFKIIHLYPTHRCLKIVGIGHTETVHVTHFLPKELYTVYIHTHIYIYIYIYIYIDSIWMDGWIDGWMDGRTDRQTKVLRKKEPEKESLVDRQTDRQTDRQIDR